MVLQSGDSKRSWRFRFVVCGLLAGLVLETAALTYLTLPSRIERRGLGAEVLDLDRADQLATVFAGYSYELPAVRAGKSPVPRLYVTNLPNDLPAIETTDQRKSLFLKSLLPLVLLVNEEVARRRLEVETLLARRRDGESLAPGDLGWLAEVADLYGVSPDDDDELLKRVDTIPPSLALAQAVLESGWGGSRFALLGNSLYGQRVWGKSQNGMAPKGLDDSVGFRVRSFEDLMASVRSYVHNLNSHRAYAKLRARRANLRRKSGWPAGAPLVETLNSYSEEGAAYAQRLRAVMVGNHLGDYDRARLEPVDG